MREIHYSVIIPTSNHPGLLARCISALLNTKKPLGGWEILIIDNSNDNQLMTENRKISEKTESSQVRYFSMPPLGLMAARHKGVEESKGQIICFIDDDSFVSETWMQGIEQTFSDPDIMLATGPILPKYETEPPVWINYLWVHDEQGKYLGYLSLLDFGEEVQDIDPTFVWGCNYLIRRNIFIKVGGSHPDYLPEKWKKYQGDGEVGLSVKVKALGYKARYCPQCTIRHLVPANRMTMDYLGKRAFFIGLHSSYTQIRREHGLGPDQGVELIKKSLYRRIRSRAGKIIYRFKTQKPKTLNEPEEISKMKQYLEECYLNGREFHRKEIEKDPALLEYVLRPKYMGENARIPGEI
jgi:glucosyl-dolichyl phosphate glucuronosyltransferase